MILSLLVLPGFVATVLVFYFLMRIDDKFFWRTLPQVRADWVTVARLRFLLKELKIPVPLDLVLEPESAHQRMMEGRILLERVKEVTKDCPPASALIGALDHYYGRYEALAGMVSVEPGEIMQTYYLLESSIAALRVASPGVFSERVEGPSRIELIRRETPSKRLSRSVLNSPWPVFADHRAQCLLASVLACQVVLLVSRWTAGPTHFALLLACLVVGSLFFVLASATGARFWIRLILMSGIVLASILVKGPLQLAAFLGALPLITAWLTRPTRTA